MKQISLILLAFCISLSGISQYQKAGYFGKDGRLYGISTRLHSLPNENGTVMGYTFSMGRDTDGKQWFSTMDFHFIPSYEVNLLIPDGSEQMGTYNTKLQVMYTLNYGYFLLNNENDKRSVKPYLVGSIGAKFLGGLKESDGFGSDLAADLPMSWHAGGGAGLFYYIKPWLGIQAEGGYSFQKPLANKELKEKDYALPSHTYIKAGLCFRIIGQ